MDGVISRLQLTNTRMPVASSFQESVRRLSNSLTCSIYVDHISSSEYSRPVAEVTVNVAMQYGVLFDVPSLVGPTLEMVVNRLVVLG
jgi:hypothetical protein